MKKITYLAMLCACATVLASCSVDNEGPGNGTTVPEGKAAVKFSTKAPSSFVGATTKALGQLEPGGFRILAYRQAPGTGDYVYYDEINTSAFTVNTSAAEYMIEGTAYLEYGQYKFVPTYGINGTTVSMPGLIGSVLTTENIIQHTVHNQALPEIFLDMSAGKTGDPISSLAGCTINLSDANQPQSPDPVHMYLTRAVGRVDVYFVKGEYDDQNNLVEVAMPAGTDVFGNYTNDMMRFNFTGLNSVVNYMGIPGTQASYKMSSTYNVTGMSGGPTVIYGIDDNPNTNTTAVGSTDYYRYDNVQPTDVARGGVYIVGPYFFPQQGTDAEADLVVEYRNVEGQISHRSIPISTKIPVKANMVTIVKIYVLAPNAYSTKANFEVEVSTVWEDPQTITEILD